MKTLMMFLVMAVGVSGVAIASTPITPVPAQADFRVAAVEVQVVLDRRDWTYRLGEVPKFRIRVSADDQPIDDATVTYAIAPDLFPGEKKTAAVPLDGLEVEGGTMQEPGFLRCIVTTEVAGRTYRGVATAAFEPEKIRAVAQEPGDFDAFWKSQIEQLAKHPLEPVLTPMPEASTDKVNVYHVSFRVGGANWMRTMPRIYGILCEPVAPGKYPAVLRVPGAGGRPYSGDKGLAERGAIVLEIGIHGIPVNMPQNVYDVLGVGALNGYWTFNSDNRETYYYNRVYLGCVRANDFLTSRPNWDGKNLAVTGASQGGQLTIVTAALDSRVTALAAIHPAGGDFEATLPGRAAGWPQPFRDWNTGLRSEAATEKRIETLRYYDVVNFAKRLKVPGYYTWGYNDETTPPTSVYAAVNVITAPKTIGLTLEMGHSYNHEQNDALRGWLLPRLGLK